MVAAVDVKEVRSDGGDVGELKVIASAENSSHRLSRAGSQGGMSGSWKGVWVREQGGRRDVDSEGSCCCYAEELTQNERQEKESHCDDQGMK